MNEYRNAHLDQRPDTWIASEDSELSSIYPICRNFASLIHAQCFV